MNINQTVFNYLEEVARWKAEVGKGNISNSGIRKLHKAGIGKSRKEYYKGMDKGTDNILKTTKRKNTQFGSTVGSLVGAIGGVAKAGGHIIKDKFSKNPPERDHQKTIMDKSKKGLSIGHKIHSLFAKPKSGKIRTNSLLAKLVGPHVTPFSPDIKSSKDHGRSFFKKNTDINVKKDAEHHIKRHESYESQAANKLWKKYKGDPDKINNHAGKFHSHLDPSVMKKEMYGQAKSKKNWHGSGTDFTSRFYRTTGLEQIRKLTGEKDSIDRIYKPNRD